MVKIKHLNTFSIKYHSTYVETKIKVAKRISQPKSILLLRFLVIHSWLQIEIFSALAMAYLRLKPRRGESSRRGTLLLPFCTNLTVFDGVFNKYMNEWMNKQKQRNRMKLIKVCIFKLYVKLGRASAGP